MSDLENAISRSLGYTADPDAARDLYARGTEPVLTIGSSSAPVGPSVGDRHIVGPSGWGGLHANAIARWSSLLAWEYADPASGDGWITRCIADGNTYRWAGTAWEVIDAAAAAAAAAAQAAASAAQSTATAAAAAASSAQGSADAAGAAAATAQSTANAAGVAATAAGSAAAAAQDTAAAAATMASAAAGAAATAQTAADGAATAASNAQNTADGAATAASNAAAAAGTAQAAADTAQADIDTHEARADNPHSVTAAQVGAVPTARVVAAGSGLTGGGSLAADRTLAVDFGVGTNQVRHGDDAAYTNSRAPSGAAAGDLGGTYPSPTVAAITETSGPTRLQVGAIAAGELLQRVGSTLVGLALSALATALGVSAATKHHWYPFAQRSGTPGTNTATRIYAFYLGVVPAGETLERVRFQLSALASGSGQCEVGLGSSPDGPNGSPPSITPISAQNTETLTSGAAGPKTNTTGFGRTFAAPTHTWAMIRSEFATTQPSMFGAINTADFSYESVYQNHASTLAALVAAGTPLTGWSPTYAIGNIPYIFATDY